MAISPHTKAVIFFITTVVVSVLIVVWFTVWNNGTLEIVGAEPFTVQIDDDRTVSCTESPCTIILKPGFYIVGVEKEDSFTQKFAVTIVRNGKTIQEVSLEQKPGLTKTMDVYTYTFSGDDKIKNNQNEINTSTLTADIPLQGLPGGTQEVVFTKAGGPVIAVTDKAIHIAATPESRFTQTEMIPTDSWMVGEENDLYYFTKNTGNSRQALMRTKITANGVTTALETPTILSYFAQHLEKALLAEAVAFGTIYIFDTGGPEGHMYSLNLDTYERTILEDLPNIDGVKGPAGSFLVLETRTSRSNTTALYLFDVSRKVLVEMVGWPEISHILFTKKGTLIVASGFDFTDASQSTPTTQETKETFWYEYDPYETKYKLLLKEELPTPEVIFWNTENQNEIQFIRDEKWQTVALDSSYK